MRHSRSRESGGTFTVRIRHLAGRLRVEVDDQGGTWQPRPGGDGQAESGRGLDIVGQLSAGWGQHAIVTGRTVWFEMANR